MELPLGFRVSGCFGTKHPIKKKREDFVNPHAYNMRTDYYVVSPNSRAYTLGGWAYYGKARAPGPEGIQRGFYNSISK